MALLANPPPGRAGDKQFLRIETFETATVNQWIAESSQMFYLLLNFL